jgi:hypothetical protein
MTLDHHKQPGLEAHAAGAASPGHHGDTPGKRTLTEALPHHAAAQDPDADHSEGGPSANVTLIAGKPARAVQPPVPAKAEPLAHAAGASRAITLVEATKLYAPVVFLATNEANRPADADEYIRNSSLRWSHDSRRGDDLIAAVGQVNARSLGHGGYTHQTEGLVGGHTGPQIPSNADVRPRDHKGSGGNEGFFLDVDNKHRASQRSGTDAPVYYEAKDRHYITYWFFYAFNDGPTQGALDKVDDHEGDWERICVRLDANNRATEVAYYQHEGHKTLPWRSVPKSGQTHPVVYSARGSHASYEAPGGKPIYKEVKGKKIQIATDQASRGAQWSTDQHLTDAHKEDWYGYGGAWGEVGNTEISTGPQGPSHHKAPAPDGW